MTLLIDDRLDDGTTGAAFVARGALGMPAGVAGPNYITPGYIGGAAVTFNTGASPVVQMIEGTSTSSTTKYQDVLCYLSAAVTTTGNVCTLRGTTDAARLGITSTNVMRLFNGSGTSLGTGSVSLPVGSWFRLSLAAVGTTATAKLYSDPTSNTATETLTGAITSTAMTLSRFGNINGINLNGGSIRFDWPQVSNDAEPVARVTTLAATAVLTPNSIGPSGSFTLDITASGGSGSYLYQVLNWGDGSTSAQQSSSSFTKTFSATSAGSKNVSYRVTG